MQKCRLCGVRLRNYPAFCSKCGLRQASVPEEPPGVLSRIGARLSRVFRGSEWTNDYPEWFDAQLERFALWPPMRTLGERGERLSELTRIIQGIEMMPKDERPGKEYYATLYQGGEMTA